MPRGGSKPGERRGGRKANVPVAPLPSVISNVKRIYLFLLAAWRTMAHGAERIEVTFTPDPVDDTKFGYFTVEENYVHIWSRNGTIKDLKLPRIGKDSSGKDRVRNLEEEVKIKYPVASPEFTDEFRSWMVRVRRVTDGGHVPTHAEIHEEWMKEHPEGFEAWLKNRLQEGSK